MLVGKLKGKKPFTNNRLGARWKGNDKMISNK
jgi:hypothetical protein